MDEDLQKALAGTGVCDSCGRGIAIYDVSIEDWRRALRVAADMASYVHHAGYPRYDGGHSEPEATCGHEDCRSIRMCAKVLEGAR